MQLGKEEGGGSGRGKVEKRDRRRFGEKDSLREMHICR